MHCLHPLLLLIRHQTHNISSMFNTPHANPSSSKPHWNPSQTPSVRRSSEIKRRLKKRNLPFALSFCFLTLTLHLKCHWSSKSPPKKTTAAAITLLLLINIHLAVVLLSLLRCAFEMGSMYTQIGRRNYVFLCSFTVSEGLFWKATQIFFVRVI